MTMINLRDFFYWYKVDEYIEVSDEVAEELRADKDYEINHWRRMKRNKANCSLDADDGIEHSICEFEPSPTDHNGNRSGGGAGREFCPGVY